MTACGIMDVPSEVGGETQPKGTNNMSDPKCECGHPDHGNDPCGGWEAQTMRGEWLPYNHTPDGWPTIPGVTSVTTKRQCLCG